MKSKLLTFTFVTALFIFLLPQLSKVEASKLLLNPPFGNVEEGKDLEVEVILNGNDENIDGVDAIITYDPSYLEVKEIKEGPFFGIYPVKKDDAGKITVTALSPVSGVKVFGDVVVVSLVFEILDSGEVELGIEFEKGSTKDSNVPLHGTTNDSLEAVAGGTYSVVATPENLAKARARKAAVRPSPLLIFIPLLILMGIGFWYWWKKRRPKEDVYVPEPFPMDKPPSGG